MPEPNETLEEFKDSFSYGSRTDLSFKFLKALSPEEAGELIQQILSEVGDLYDGVSPERLIDLVYEWQVRAYQPKPEAQRPWVYEDHPFTLLNKPLSETVVGLVTSSGHYVEGEAAGPFDVEAFTQDEIIGRIDEFLRTVPGLSEIPREADPDSIQVRHPGYDVRSVSKDLGVAFPRAHLLDAEKKGRIGRLADTLYSFVGACSQGRLRNELASWVERWRQADVEALFLVPV